MEYGEVKRIEHLLVRGVDPNVRSNCLNQTPLHAATLNNRTSAMRLLLDRGADIHARDEFDQTPLDLAICKGHEKAITVLLVYSANLGIAQNI